MFLHNRAKRIYFYPCHHTTEFMKSNVAFLCFALAYAMISLGNSPLMAQDPAADDAKKAVEARGATIIVALEGEVTITNNRTGKALEPAKVVIGASIPDGHTVKTAAGAKVTFLLSNGSVFTVSENSEMIIAQFTQEAFKATDDKLTDLETEPSTSKTTLSLSYGNMVTNIKKLNKGSAFTINSPLGSAGVRGTTVSTEAIPQAGGGFTGGTGVTNGTIAFTPTGAAPGAAPQVVAAGQEVTGAATATGEVTTAPPAPMPPAKQAEMTATATQATTASADISVAETQQAATTVTQQVQAEVDAGAPAEPNPPAAVEPDPDAPDTPDPDAPSPEEPTETEPAAEADAAADSTIDPNSIDPNVLSPDTN